MLRLLGRRQQKLLPNRNQQKQIQADSQHTVTASRNQWRLFFIILIALTLVIYALGSVNGLALVNRSVDSQFLVSTPVVIVSTSIPTSAPTLTPDAGAEALMQATVAIAEAHAVAGSSAIATQSAIDLKLNEAIAEATIHAVAVEKNAREQSLEMNLSASEIENRRAG